MTAEIRVDRITSRTGINTLSFSDNGFSFISNTGIGTTNPTSKLTVLGNVDVTGVVTATTFVGALTGTASNVTTNANLTGDVTSTGNATAIAAGVIVDADINASAAIALSKLGTTGSINTSGIITATSFSGSGSGLTGIVNSGITTVAAGTTALPSISPTGDSNTGIFFPSADTIAFAEGGAEAARFDSSGRLLVGTSSAFSTSSNALIQAVNTSGGEIVIGRDFALGSGSTIGRLAFFTKPSAVAEAARIEAVADALHSGGAPTRLVFSTTADGASSPTEAMRINNQQELLVGTATRTANGGKLQISNGITFPATAVACTDANTLDDYEEGTWTPVVSFGGASVGITGTFSGTYTKVGNVVTVTYILSFTSKGSSTGSMLVSGMPFNGALSLNTISGFGYIHRLAALQTAGQLYLGVSGTTFSPNFAGYNGGNTTTLTNTDIGNDTDLRGGIVFRV
jgi:hypothetical protein